MTTFVREILGNPSPSGQSRMEAEVRFAGSLDSITRAALGRLLSAWYHVGACGGYEGVMFHQFDEPEVDDRAVHFGVVVGGDPLSALDVLQRCLDDEVNDFGAIDRAATKESTYRS